MNYTETIPEPLKRLLQMEGHLNLARERIAKSIAELEARFADAKKGQQSFLTVKEGQANKHLLKRLKRDLDILRAGDRATSDLETRLEKVILPHLSHFLRVQSTEYRTGLATGEFSYDWERALDILGSRLEDFVKWLGIARNQSEDSFFQNAVDAAGEVDKEIRFINHLLVDPDLTGEETADVDIAPVIPAICFQSRLDGLKNQPRHTVQNDFSQIVEQAKLVKDNLIPQARSRFATLSGIAKQSANKDESVLFQFWEYLKKDALDRWVDRTQNDEALLYIENEIKKCESRPVLTSQVPEA